MPRRAAWLWSRAPRWSPTSVSPVTRDGGGLGRRGARQRRRARASCAAESFQRTLAPASSRAWPRSTICWPWRVAPSWWWIEGSSVTSSGVVAQPPAGVLALGLQQHALPVAGDQGADLRVQVEADDEGHEAAAVGGPSACERGQAVLAAQLVGLDVEVEPALVAQAEAARPSRRAPAPARARRGASWRRTSTHRRRRRAGAGPAPGRRSRCSGVAAGRVGDRGGGGGVDQAQGLRAWRVRATSRSRRSAARRPPAPRWPAAGRRRRRSRRPRPARAASAMTCSERASSRW